LSVLGAGRQGDSSSLAAPLQEESSSAGDAALLLIHSAAVRRYCRSQLAEADADDAIQDTFVRFLTRKPGAITNVEAWLITAARRACQDLVRRRMRCKENQLPEVPLNGANGDFEDPILTATLVRSLLRGLSERDATLLARVYIGGWTFDQVAKELDVPAVHVRMMAVRARRRARRALQGTGISSSALGLVPWAAGSGGTVRGVMHGLRNRFALKRQSTLSHLTAFAELPASALTNCAVVLLSTGVVLAAAAPISTPGRLPAPPASHGKRAAAAGPAPTSLGTSPDAGASIRTPNWQPSQTASPGGDAMSWLNGSVQANRNPQPQDASFSSLTPSPHYRQDHTVFASGSQVQGCATPCPVLFDTTDGGTTWQHLQGLGFQGGQVLVPPAFPSDPTLFAVGPAGLQRSNDAGATFTTEVPGVTDGAMEPATAAGQAMVVLALDPLVVYSQASGLVAPGPALPPGIASVQGVTALSDGRLVVTAQRLDPSAPGQADGVILLCGASGCAVEDSYPGLQPGLLVASPGLSSDTVVAAMGESLMISADSGAAFRRVALPDGDQPIAVSADPAAAASPGIFIDALTSGAVPTTILLSTADAGVSLSSISLAGLPARLSVGAVSALPDGKLLIGLTTAGQSGTFGIRCSTDAGASWRTSCS